MLNPPVENTGPHLPTCDLLALEETKEERREATFIEASSQAAHPRLDTCVVPCGGHGHLLSPHRENEAEPPSLVQGHPGPARIWTPVVSSQACTLTLRREIGVPSKKYLPLSDLTLAHLGPAGFVCSGASLEGSQPRKPCRQRQL